MTLNELSEIVDELKAQGLGECEIIKSSDDEGNSYQLIHHFQETPCLFRGPYDIDVLADEDIPDYEEEETFKKVIGIW